VFSNAADHFKSFQKPLAAFKPKNPLLCAKLAYVQIVPSSLISLLIPNTAMDAEVFGML